MNWMTFEREPKTHWLVRLWYQASRLFLFLGILAFPIHVESGSKWRVIQNMTGITINAVTIILLRPVVSK